MYYCDCWLVSLVVLYRHHLVFSRRAAQQLIVALNKNNIIVLVIEFKSIRY
jgi:hypothetical protein